MMPRPLVFRSEGELKSMTPLVTYFRSKRELKSMTPLVTYFRSWGGVEIYDTPCVT